LIRLNAGVSPAIDLAAMTGAKKDVLILSLLPLVGQLEAALARVAVLEARVEELTRPPRIPDNSSTPPVRGHKPDRSSGDRHPRGSRPEMARALAETPDRVLGTCPARQAVFPSEVQTPQSVYDRIELPPVRSLVTRVHLFGGRSACCGVRSTAAAPARLDLGSPFEYSIEAMVVYLHYAHAMGLERLRVLMGEVFGLSISEGALCNILARAREPLGAAAATITAQVREARVVCSDETSVQVAGRTWWEWVFVIKAAVLHVIRPSRGRVVPRACGLACGCRTRWATSAGTPSGGRCAWRTCCATRNGPSTAATRGSACGSGCGCCRRWRSGESATGCATTHPCNTAITLSDGSTASWPTPCRRDGREAALPYRPLPGAPERVRHRPQRAADQQRLQTRTAAQHGVPQGHQRV
jgi:hypothetical protein